MRVENMENIIFYMKRRAQSLIYDYISSKEPENVESFKAAMLKHFNDSGEFGIYTSLRDGFIDLAIVDYEAYLKRFVK
jgi:stalled ribosome rescue protein Dom34